MDLSNAIDSKQCLSQWRTISFINASKHLRPCASTEDIPTFWKEHHGFGIRRLLCTHSDAAHMYLVKSRNTWSPPSTSNGCKGSAALNKVLQKHTRRHSDKNTSQSLDL